MEGAGPTGAAARFDVRLWSALGTVYLVWGSTYLGTAILAESIPPLIGVGVRYLLAAVLLGAFLALRSPGVLRITRAELRTCAVLGVTMMSACLGILALALHYVPTGVAALLVCVMPIWVVLLRLVTGERPGWRTLTGVSVGFAGVLLMLLPGGGSSTVHGGSTQLFWWSLAILGSSALWAWASWSAPSMPAPASGPAATFYQLCIGGAVLVVVGLLLGERLVLAEVTGRSALALVYLVVIGSLVAWTAFTWVLRNVPVSLGATYAYVNPVVAVLLGVLFYGEVFSLDVVIGCTVVLGGVALVVSGESAGLRSRRSSRNDAQAPTVSTMDARST